MADLDSLLKAAGAGAVGGMIVSRYLVWNQPAIARRLGLLREDETSAAQDDGPPAVEPSSIPVAVDPTEAAEIGSIPHPELRRVLTTLRSWKPKRHRAEDAFQRSFAAHLTDNGYSEDDVDRHPTLPWTAHDRDPRRGDKTARPDFLVEGKVLVEIKRNITRSGDSDRSLGQMQRYSIAWRRFGPALLVVCNDYDENLRAFIEKTVRAWKSHGAPVMAYFARHPSVVDDDDRFPDGMWR